MFRSIRSAIGRGLAEAWDLARTLDRDDLLVALSRVLFEVSPAVRQHISDCLLVELKEEVARTDPGDAERVINLIE